MADDQTYKPLTMTRTFQASREKVWDAWTNPDAFSKWWSPDGFTVPTCELDVHVGGRAYVVMRGPDGTDFPMESTYEVVTKPERIVWLNRPLDKEGKPLFEIRQTITLTEDGTSTTLEITAEVVSAGPDAAPYLSGMEEGLTQSLQKLSNLF